MIDLENLERLARLANLAGEPKIGVSPVQVLDLIGIACAAADSLPKIKEGAQVVSFSGDERFNALLDAALVAEHAALRLDGAAGTGLAAVNATKELIAYLDSNRAPASQAAAPTTGPQEVLRLSGYQLAEALNMAWPDRADHDQGETEIGFWIRSKAETIDGDECPAGVYGFWADYPEEGSVLVDGSQFENAVCLAGTAPVEAAKPEGWTANTGDEPLFLVDLEFRDGSIENGASAGNYHWHLDGKDCDIVRWRPAAPAPEAQ